MVPRHGRRRLAQHQRHRARPGRHHPGPCRRPHLQDGLRAVRGGSPPPPGRCRHRRPPRPAGRSHPDGDPRARRERPRHRVAGEAEAAQERPRLDGRLRLLKKTLRRWLSEDRVDFGANVIPAMLEAGARVFGYRYNGYWQDVGTIQSFWETCSCSTTTRTSTCTTRTGSSTRSEERGPARSGRRRRSTRA